MNLESIILLPIEQFDQEVGNHLQTNDCDEVYRWQLERWDLFRSVMLFRLSGKHLDPTKNVSFVENSGDSSLIYWYAAVEEKFPLQTEKTTKEKIRERIYAEIGDYDVYEMIADVSKRLCMLERIAIFHAYLAWKNGTLTGHAIVDKYGMLMEDYMQKLQSEEMLDRTDLEPYTDVFEKLSIRFTKIANIVKEEMYQE